MKLLDALKETGKTAVAVFVGVGLVQAFTSLNATHSQQAVPQQEQADKKTPSITTSVLDSNSNAVVLKPRNSDASVYAITHSSLDPTMWILEEVGDTASTSTCNKNPLLPARKVGDYCVASFKINIKDAVCYLTRKSLNTIECTWPNNHKEKQ